MNTTPAPRSSFIDALKAVGSQLIVLHHLAFYGPMSDVAESLAPQLMAWFSRDARFAVQVFLVVGGFLAAKALAPEGRLLTIHPLETLKNRYFKLVLPFLAALVLAVVCAALARQLIAHDATPGAPNGAQFLAHVLLLHSVLGVEVLTAGAWYVAIDFQLFALLLAALWLGKCTQRTQRPDNPAPTGLFLAAMLGLASLFYFNRDATWDTFGVYFFGSYALGAFAFWIASGKQVQARLLAMAAITIVALCLDFRSRIALALLVALVLGTMQGRRQIACWPQNRGLTYLGKISYSVFLVNFPVSLLINALFARYVPSNPWLNLVGILIAWLACTLVGAVFFHLVECRTRVWQAAAYQFVNAWARRLRAAFL